MAIIGSFEVGCRCCRPDFPALLAAANKTRTALLAAVGEELGYDVRTGVLDHDGDHHARTSSLLADQVAGALDGPTS